MQVEIEPTTVSSHSRSKMSSIQSIPEFYKGQTIFITGATGFMGKVLMEKLLRSCPGLKRIYILIRPKKGRDAHERLDELLETRLFDPLKTEQPNFKTKVVPIVGDILKEEMAISHSDVQLLADETTIVFHSAATVKFDEEMKLSIDMNVLGSQKLLNLCKKMTKLQALVHISTAYANCNRERVEEKVYKSPLDPQKLLSATEWMDTEVLNLLSPKLVGNRPNTYTYTKAVAESLVREECGMLPLAILRPSIVGATLTEPFPGWVDNFNGPTGLLAAIGHGLLRCMKGDRHAIADLIPCDIVVKAIIAVAWQTAIEKPNEIKVYNCTSGQVNKVTWGEVELMAAECMKRNPLNKVARVPTARLTKSKVWHYVNFIVDHSVPAYFMDFYLWITGRQPIFVKVNDRLRKTIATLDYFTSNTWHFSNDNLLALFDKLSPDDQKIFNFDSKLINWPSYVESYALGTKQFLLNEKLTELPQARATLKRLQRLSLAGNVILIIVVCRLLINRIAVAKSVWQFLIGWVLKIFNKIPGVAKSS